MTTELVMALCAIASTLGTGGVVVYRLGKMAEKIDHVQEFLREHTNTRERLSALEAVVFDRRENP